MARRWTRCAAIVAAAAMSFAGAQRRKAPAPQPQLPCGNPLAFQVLLDRQGFSPGEIDGRIGSNAHHALAALQTARGVAVTGEADCETWHALGGDTSGSVVTKYRIAAADLRGPFEKRIPADLEKQAALPAMSYRSAVERLAEKFHVAPALLLRINRRNPIAEGKEIDVPAVTPFDAGARLARDPEAGDLAVDVSRDDSSLRVLREDGSVVFFAPVTTGSEHDPLPPGTWKVTGVDWHPVFHYNPKLFWDANPAHAKATIKPGPNNPVGVVWIGLNLEHYGIHGTPEPSRIGQTESHGCVRLTNWDAARLAALVKPGTPVVFR